MESNFFIVPMVSSNRVETGIWLGFRANFCKDEHFLAEVYQILRRNSGFRDKLKFISIIIKEKMVNESRLIFCQPFLNKLKMLSLYLLGAEIQRLFPKSYSRYPQLVG